PNRMVEGRVAGADAFDGNGDYFNMTNFNHVNQSSQLTISAWSYLEDPESGDSAILSKDIGSQNGFLLMYDFDAGLGLERTYIFNVGSTSDRDNRVVASDLGGRFIGEWTHITGVMNGSSRAIYLDGTLETAHSDASVVTVPNRSDSARLGSWEHSAATAFDGKIDEVRISSVARSSNWIWAVWMNMASNHLFNEYEVEPSPGRIDPIENRTPSWLGSNTVSFNGSLNASGAVYDVFVYWGMTDGGTHPAFWAHAAPLGRFTNLFTDLQRIETLPADTNWFYTFRATNCSEDVWAAPTRLVEGLAPLSVNNGGGATDIGIDLEATLNGHLERNTAAVTVFWGLSDGGTNPAAWKHAVSLGTLSTGSFSTSVTGIYYGATYYYRTYASNAIATAWADDTATFQNRKPAGPKSMTVDFCGYHQDETLHDFPVLVTLSPTIPGFSYGEFLRPDGYDLRVEEVNGADTLNYEIETWNPEGTSYIWIQLPALAGPSTRIHLTWGDPMRTNQPTYTTDGSTWSAGYAGVWHLNETAGPINDSARLAPPGLATGDPVRVANGLVSGADEFDDDGDYFTVANFNHVNQSSQLTISAWSYLEKVEFADSAILSKSGISDNGFLLMYDFGISGIDHTYFFNVGPTAESGNRVIAPDRSGYFPQQWKHVTGVMNGSSRA
ncbi:MAG: LamG domain-containing protein, partial [Verrucomicrobiota bacterium]